MKYRRSFLTLALTALFVLVAGPSYAIAQNTDSAAISKLLNEARTYAVQADSDTAELESYTNSRLHWQTHAQQLEIIRSHVNNLGRVVKEMQDMKGEGSPWQQDAIDRINPLLSQMAQQLTTIIEYGNKNPNRIHMMEYKNYVRSGAELAAQTSRLISDIVAYDRAQSRAQRLEQTLELPPHN
jgi:hypothetical protein